MIKLNFFQDIIEEDELFLDHRQSCLSKRTTMQYQKTTLLGLVYLCQDTKIVKEFIPHVGKAY